MPTEPIVSGPVNSAGQFIGSNGVGNVIDGRNILQCRPEWRRSHRAFLNTHRKRWEHVLLLVDPWRLSAERQHRSDPEPAGWSGPGTIGGWDAIQAEASGGNYKVLWKNADGAYSEWTVNSAGQFIGSNGVGNVIDVETYYNADLNGDGRTGHFSTLIENDGSTSFYSSTHGVYLLNDNIGLTLNGGLVGPGTIGGWDAIQAEASGGNYKVLWKNADGAYSEWTVNSGGPVYWQ